jgi:hypothetical protein
LFAEDAKRSKEQVTQAGSFSFSLSLVTLQPQVAEKHDDYWLCETRVDRIELRYLAR